MAVKVERTYWGSKGLYQDLADQLTKLIPEEGACTSPRGANKRLDQYRRACNAYYDIFNNGGGNRATLIRSIFDISMNNFRYGGRRGRYGCPPHTRWDAIHAITEPRMDEIILDAAVEQGLMSPLRRRALDYLARMREDAHPDLIEELRYVLNEEKSS